MIPLVMQLFKRRFPPNGTEGDILARLLWHQQFHIHLMHSAQCQVKIQQFQLCSILQKVDRCSFGHQKHRECVKSKSRNLATKMIKLSRLLERAFNLSVRKKKLLLTKRQIAAMLLNIIYKGDQRFKVLITDGLL